MPLWVAIMPVMALGPNACGGPALSPLPRSPFPLKRPFGQSGLCVFGGRPALRPFAAAPRSVASARRPAPRAPLRVFLLSVSFVSIRRLCVSVRFSFVGGRAVGGAPSGPSWARYARSALNGPSWGSPSLSAFPIRLRAFAWFGRVWVGLCAPRSSSAWCRYAPHADAARCAPFLSPPSLFFALRAFKLRFLSFRLYKPLLTQLNNVKVYLPPRSNRVNTWGWQL